MANWKKIAGGVVVLAVVAGAGAGWWLWDTINWTASSVADDQVKLADFHTDDKAAIERGQYVARLGDCAACHTRGQGELAGGYKIATNFGTLVSSNITPDRETGIGNMTEKGFFNAVRQGIGMHGPLYPAMPFTAYRKFTDQDMHDLWAYMSTVKPVSNEIHENAGMNFPYNIRLAMVGWDMLFFDNSGFKEDSSKDADWNRGRYIVEGGAHCSACHSPRNALGGEKTSKFLWGANIGTEYAPDITQNPHTGIGDWSKQDLVNYLTTGTNGKAIAAGSMGEAVEHSFQYLTKKDAEDVATYVMSLPASPATAPAGVEMPKADHDSAALNYEVSCSACHGVKGEGIEGGVPAFAGNKGLLSDDATSLVRAMLVGARAPHTSKVQTAAGMPSFAWKYDDKQIADLLTYVRNSWGNKGAAVTPAEVAKLRDTLNARDKAGTTSN